jgi:hypothetical protein
MKMATVTVLAVIAFLGSLAVADAQSRVQNGAPPGVQNGDGTSDVQSGAKTSETAPKNTLNPGINYRHIWNCFAFRDLGFFQVSFLEGGETLIVGTDATTTQLISSLKPACQTGNWVGLEMDNGGLLISVTTWPFR